MPELDLPMLDLSEFDVRTEEEVERANAVGGTPGPGKVKDDAGCSLAPYRHISRDA